MDITQIDEQWVKIPKIRVEKKSIIAISNTGKYRRVDGTEGSLGLRQKFFYNGELELCYRIIAEHFLITVKRQDQDQIDHITHNPSEYEVNDVRNLRWCTKAENNGFEEAIFNKSGSKASSWKGNKANPKAKYVRALKEYRSNPTQENLATLKEARLKRNEYRGHLRRAKKSRQ